MISAENRDVSRRKALRKRRIAREICDWDMYDNLHQYSKNKVHCSCPYCNAKTRNKGSRRGLSGNYQRSLHYTASDMRKVLTLDEDLREEGYYAPRHKRNRFS
jgi:transposase-like protein